MLFGTRQMPERLKIACRLTTGGAPLVLLADGIGESEFQQGVEASIGILDDGTEHLVDLLRRNGSEREAADEIDVTEAINGITHPVHTEIAFEQPAMDGLVVLIGATYDERLDGEGMTSDSERARGGQLAR